LISQKQFPEWKPVLRENSLGQYALHGSTLSIPARSADQFGGVTPEENGKILRLESAAFQETSVLVVVLRPLAGSRISIWQLERRDLHTGPNGHGEPGLRPLHIQNWSQFLAVSAQLMRRILVDPDPSRTA